MNKQTEIFYYIVFWIPFWNSHLRLLFFFSVYYYFLWLFFLLFDFLIQETVDLNLMAVKFEFGVIWFVNAQESLRLFLMDYGVIVVRSDVMGISSRVVFFGAWFGLDWIDLLRLMGNWGFGLEIELELEELVLSKGVQAESVSQEGKTVFEFIDFESLNWVRSYSSDSSIAHLRL